MQKIGLGWSFETEIERIAKQARLPFNLEAEGDFIN